MPASKGSRRFRMHHSCLACQTNRLLRLQMWIHFCQLAFALLGCLSETWLWNFSQIWSSIWPRATLKARIPQSSFVSVCLTLNRISKAQHFKNHQLSMLMRTIVISRVFCSHKLSQQQGPLPCLQTRTFANVAYQFGEVWTCSDLRQKNWSCTDHVRFQCWMCYYFMGQCMGHAVGPRFTWYWKSANDANIYETFLRRVLCIRLFLYRDLHPAASCL